MCGRTTAPMATSLRVLILEDDAALRGVLKQLLEEQGYQVQTAACASEALDWSRRAEFDLVVVDVRMEGMDGLEALSQVQEAQPAIGSMVMTGYSTEEDSIRAIHLGVREYLKKPFDLQVFLEALERIAAQRRQELERNRVRRVAARAVLWALREVGGRHGRLLQVADFARGVALQLGASATEADTVWAGLVLQALARHQELPGELEQLFPPLKGPGPRLVEQAARLIEHPPSQGETVSACLGLASSDPLAQAMDVLWGKSPPPAPGPAQHRGLLALSQALLLSGKTEEAMAGLREVAYQGNEREELEASLWMARASARQSDADGLRTVSKRARELARLVGPQALARTTLEVALLGAELNPEEAAEGLTEAIEQLARLGLEAEEARARLALRHYSGNGSGEELSRAVGLLLQPAHLSELVGSLLWLVPILLEQAGGEGDIRVLSGLAQQFPREFVRCLSTDVLSVGARCAAAACLSPSNPWHRMTLSALAEDVDPQVQAAACAALERQGVVAPPLLRLLSLGSFEVYLGDEPVPDTAWKGQKTRYLLACLASNRGQVVPEDRLIDHLWPDSAPERGRKNLYTTTSYLRAALKLTDWSGTLEFVVRSGPGLALNARMPRWHDLEEFERLAAQARKSPPAQALECWRKALRLYRGPFLDGCAMEWADNPRRRLEREVLSAMEEMARLSLAQNQSREGLEFALRLLDLDPCHTEGCQMAMQASYALGRHEESVRLFERFRRNLERELKVEPPIPLLELYHRARMEL